MNPKPMSKPKTSQGGFSLVELMVAITIGLFISIALGAVFINTKSTFTSQSALATLHENQRLANSLLTAQVQLAGYYPDPSVNTPASMFPADASTQAYGRFTAGIGVVGVSGTGTASDTFAVRFARASGDGLLDCQGGTNSTGSNQVALGIYSISANAELQCATAVSQTPVALVSNVQSLKVLYATDTSNSGNADQYLTASAVTAAGLWGNVKSLQITLVFTNPYASGGNAVTAPPITWTQNIGVMGTL